MRARARRRIWASKRVRRWSVLLVALMALLGGGWLWLRDSSLVAVEHVTISGETGPDAGQIRAALLEAARNMTTLDVHVPQLRNAVAPFPIVRDVQVSSQFPHGMRIRVIEQIPVAAVMVAGRAIPVSADGTLLHDLGTNEILPLVPLRVPPGGARLTDPDALSAVTLLAAAPAALLPKISQVTHDPTHGLTAQVRAGPVIYFGDATRLVAKWIAASEVLASPGSAGAAYIDVTDPQRPAAGAGSGAASSGIGTSLGAGAGGSVAGGSGPVAGPTGSVAGAARSVAGATGSVAGATGSVAGATGSAAGAAGSVAGASGSAGGAPASSPTGGATGVGPTGSTGTAGVDRARPPRAARARPRLAGPRLPGRARAAREEPTVSRRACRRLGSTDAREAVRSVATPRQ